MSRKKQENSAGENGKYLCSQCFTTHYSNDVLFATPRMTKRYDLRQARLRYALQTPEAFEDWCGKGEALILADWRGAGAQERILTDGVVVGMRNVNGEELRHRVCPQCHCVILPEMILMGGWSAAGVDTAAARAMLHSVGAAPGYRCDTVMATELQQVLPYEVCSRSGTTVHYGVPTGLEDAVSEEAQRYHQAYISSCHAAVLTLDLAEYEGATPDQNLDFGAAEDVTDAFLAAAGYVGDPLEKPVVVVLNGLQAGVNPQRSLEQRARPLLNHLQLCLKNVRFLVGADDPDSNARQALEWIAAQLARTGQAAHG